MRIQIVSDLHLERYPDYRPQPAPGVDLLVLAGDIGSYQLGSRLAESDWGLTRFSPARGAPWPQVVFVPGNHEYDALPHGPTRERLQRLCTELGIVWLDREVAVIDGVRFLGTTLWADFDALADQPGAPRVSETDRLRQREKALRAADFYLRKNTTLLDGEPMLSDRMRGLALQCQDWLRQALAQPFEGRTVVITHFAPSLLSADPRYGVTPGTAGFCNSLDDLVPLADWWIHGHLHCPQDYVVEGMRHGRPARGRVLANPRGYDSKGEQAAFRDAWALTLAAD